MAPLALLDVGGVRAWCIGKSLGGAPFDARDADQIRRLSDFLVGGLPIRQAPQIHGDRIDLDGTAEACDAFLVRPGEAALVRHADCFPVVIAAPSSGFAVVAHCGWKGVHLDLAGKAVRKLLDLGASREDLWAAIGPGIGPGSFEVGPEVRALFPESCHATTTWFTGSVDLPRRLAGQLGEAGVREDRIRLPARDTFPDPEFHSHRREQESAGRNATVCIVLKDPSQPEKQP